MLLSFNYECEFLYIDSSAQNTVLIRPHIYQLKLRIQSLTSICASSILILEHHSSDVTVSPLGKLSTLERWYFRVLACQLYSFSRSLSN